MPLEPFYLPRESLTLVNYPVLREQREQIENMLVYALQVQTAITDYNEAKVDHIDVNMDELDTRVGTCRQVCEALGTADQVPFDILIELRMIQVELQHLVYLYRLEGRQRIDPVSQQTQAEEGI